MPPLIQEPEHMTMPFIPPSPCRPSACRAAGLAACLLLACGAADAAAGQLQKFLDRSKAYAALPRVAHVPQFHLESIPPGQHAAGTEWWYVLDGDERIGLIQTWTKEIELFTFRPRGSAVGPQPEIPNVHHWATLIGARIQMYGTQGFPLATGFTVRFTKDRGDTLAFTSEQEIPGGISGTSEFRLSWDEKLGYVWHGVTRFSTPKSIDVEFNNLLAGGVSESRADRKRWQKTVRSHADGRIVFVHHNPLNLPAEKIAPGGFVGFVAEDGMNPFVDIEQTSEPVRMSTCSQWYDQHIIMKRPAAPGSDDRYHTEASYRFLSLPGPVARELEAEAVSVEKGPGDSGRMGFLQNVVNDFETGVPFGQVYNGPTWRHANTTDACAHSGKKSLELAGTAHTVNAVSPIGAGTAIYGETKKRYRLSGWVKTRGPANAWLQIDDVIFNWEDVKASHRTEKLAGDKDWTRLDAEFTPAPNDPFLLVKLCVEGSGTAWFDDLELVEIPSSPTKTAASTRVSNP